MTAYLDRPARSLVQAREDLYRSIIIAHAHNRRACTTFEAWDTLARVDEEIKRRRPQ